MMDILRDKSAIFFDVGYTLMYPVSGDWTLTRKFNSICGERCYKHSREEISKAMDKCFIYLENNHMLRTSDVECEQFTHFYKELSDLLDLGLTREEIEILGRDRTYNMANYALYPDVVEVLEALRKTYRLGIISDTWPSIEPQLCTLGIRDYFETVTYSCSLGVFKPNERMYKDALEKMGLTAEKTVFIDDGVRNLTGAAGLGITPILIAANTVSDVEVSFTKIHTLSELIRE